MASRQDQLHSYQFSVQRVVAALVLREPDAAASPGRRLAGATFAGLLVAALSLAGAAVIGLVRPGASDAWRAPGTVIVERESGARYVILDDDKLHPVLNYASARLLAGGGKSATVPSGQLAGVARGVPLGIPGAPDSLPAKENLESGAWRVCSDAQVRSVLAVSAAAGGGKPLVDNGLLVRTPDGTEYLLQTGRALRIPRPALVGSAFSWGGEPVTPVAPALVDAVAAGPDLAPPAIPGAGRLSGALAGLRVGTVLVSQAQGGAKQFGVVLDGGLAPISQVQADLLLADPDLATLVGRGTAREISQADFASAPVAALAPDALPRTTPALAQPAGSAAVCASAPAGGPATVTVDATVDSAAAAPAGGTGAGGARLADLVVVRPGHGALVAAVASPADPGGALFLVTDVGRRYAVPSDEVAGVLGYGGYAPVRVPAALVALLPAGPALDPAAARQPA